MLPNPLRRLQGGNLEVFKVRIDLETTQMHTYMLVYPLGPVTKASPYPMGICTHCVQSSRSNPINR